jgi:hypothetical protein
MSLVGKRVEARARNRIREREKKELRVEGPHTRLEGENKKSLLRHVGLYGE